MAEFSRDRYLPHVREHLRSAGNIDAYLRLRILPHLGARALDEVTQADVAALRRRLSAQEKDRLRDLLGSLQDYGLILPPAFAAASDAFGFPDAVDLVRQAVGPIFVDAALFSGGRPGPGSDPDPVAAMPVWPFEPERAGSDVLVSSARLWGVDLFVEALRVEDDEEAAPVPAVRERYARWLAAAGAELAVRPVRLPGRPGSYAVFAAAAPN